MDTRAVEVDIPQSQATISESQAKALSQALKAIRGLGLKPREGLPEELFLFATSITPMVNVDLLVRDEQGRILLSWRDDAFCGVGWHVPGGIVRFQESMATRLQKTALAELGCEVQFAETPLEIIELVQKERNERSHFISFVYDCRLPDNWSAENQPAQPQQVGFLAWHEFFPENMIAVHHCYKKYFR